MDKIKENIRLMLTPKRYEHVLGVEEVAIELAAKYGANLEKVRKAALLHDCSKQFTITKMRELCDCDETLKNYGHLGELIHGFAGSVYAKMKFGITDQEILDAIRYHTIGRRDMSLVEKITYLADAIEPNRDYADVEHIRHLAFKNIDMAILHETDRKIEYLIKREAVIHPNTVDMRNWLLSEVKKGEI
ncbi:bis(5'-nucleosyl)-tetraphosphatase (symmetrical) YqeK [uncultured Ilyobacter sp.]|uniref:bis(5'-nucleosyl)-tetraphosphatase (symmetrical) YqeK n=1 Tax=uncultured Ilyobacter sp. TaxID=544433 RepID=UPI0029C9AFAB|nr:bis(5'-nucleosyl)-tetraphosphatase (symmetrical) YqeK [uncultured Ilyobacter sp.]